jgi:hypothetical protein
MPSKRSSHKSVNLKRVLGEKRDVCGPVPLKRETKSILAAEASCRLLERSENTCCQRPTRSARTAPGPALCYAKQCSVSCLRVGRKSRLQCAWKWQFLRWHWPQPIGSCCPTLLYCTQICEHMSNEGFKGALPNAVLWMRRSPQRCKGCDVMQLPCCGAGMPQLIFNMLIARVRRKPPADADAAATRQSRISRDASVWSTSASHLQQSQLQHLRQHMLRSQTCSACCRHSRRP